MALVHTIALKGLTPTLVYVECIICDSAIPRFIVIGLPDKSVLEAKERVLAVFQCLNLQLPPKKITINLAPANIKKEGNHYDLPIALALLVTLQILPSLTDILAIGELSLNGTLLKVQGALIAGACAAENNLDLICPHNNGSEAAWGCATGNVLAPHNLQALINHFKGFQPLSPAKPKIIPQIQENGKIFDSILGQSNAKRSCILSCAGGHSLFMIGPPGAGKTSICSAAIELLPNLNISKAIEVAKIYSAAGLQNSELSLKPPLQAPHYTISTIGLVGGGSGMLPGVISLAHNGLLFLDELGEFSQKTLDALRVILDQKFINISRALYHTQLPADFLFFAASNPCNCIAGKSNKCSNKCIRNVLSDAIADRIDMFIYLSKPINSLPGYSFEYSKNCVHKMRMMQALRFQNETWDLNANIENSKLDNYIICTSEIQKLFIQITSKYQLSHRKKDKLLKLAKTITDLSMLNLSIEDIAGNKTITKEALLEAIDYIRISLSFV